MTTANGNISDRQITNLDISSYQQLKHDNPIQIILGDNYSSFICGNGYRSLKDRNGNWVKNVEILINDLIYFLMGEGYIDSHCYLIMQESAIGRRLKDSSYEWQRFDEDTKWRIITFNRILLQKTKKAEYEALAEANDELGLNQEDEPIEPLLPDHPLNDNYLLVNVQIELGKRIVREERNRMIVFIGLVSAFLLKKPLGCAGLGLSSVGKSMLFETVLHHFPRIYPNDKEVNKAGWFKCNQIKEAALFRLDEDWANNSIFYLGEMPDTMSDTQKELYGYLRQLQSEGEIAKTLSEPRNGTSGALGWIAVSYSLKANISFFALSVEGFEEQFGNRQIMLSFDESEAQTNRIADWKVEIQMSATDNPKIAERLTKSEYIINLVNGLNSHYYKQFEQSSFNNPYADITGNILKKLYSGSIQLRRVTEYVFNFIEVITRIQVANRDVESAYHGDTTWKIIATAEDNLIGLYLLWNSLEQAIKNITRPDTENFDLIKKAIKSGDNITYVKNSEYEEGNWWTVNKMAKAINKGTTGLRDSLMRLVKARKIESKIGSSNAKWWKYKLPKNLKLMSSIEPSDILPFFIEKGSWNCSRLGCSFFEGVCGDVISIHRKPILELLLQEPILRVCTDIISVYIIYIYIVQDVSSIWDRIKEDRIEENVLVKFLRMNGYAPPSTPLEKRAPETEEMVFSEWLSQIKLPDRSLLPIDLGMKNQNIEETEQNPIKMDLKERILYIIKDFSNNSGSNEKGISLIDLLKEINIKRKKPVDKKRVDKIIDDLIYVGGEIHEPMPEWYKTIE